MQRMVRIGIFLIMLALAACGGSDSDKNDSDGKKKVTVGVLNPAAFFEPAVEGFKAGMAEKGYIEGENITYLYDGPAADMEALEAAFQDMLSEHKVDLFLTAGTPATLLAKVELADKDIPIVFAPVNDPVGSGVVESLVDSGGNVTGVKAANSTVKTLEWLVTLVPDIKRVFVPHNPNDSSSVQSIASLQPAAEELGVELVIQEVITAEDITAASAQFPPDVDAVFFPREGPLTDHIGDFVQTANAQGIPVVYAEIGHIIEQGVMLGYGENFYDMGIQASGLANRILEGVAADKLPVQEAEAFLGINLETAAIIDVEIPDYVINQAVQVVRGES